MPRLAVALLGMMLLLSNSPVNAAEPDAVDFNRDIRPILSEHCFQCHGPDANTRKADLRLDEKAGLFGDRGGYVVIAPGRPEDSELLARITSDDKDTQMPPAGKLAPEKIALIRRWIEQQAEWKGHWAWYPPARPALPEVEDSAFVRNEIDRFIMRKLRQKGLNPSPEADRVTLIRRLSYDLTGLPPMPAQVDAFLNDTSPEAYERVVDRLLASPQYGERMAIHWLDLVRYADTIGYHSDTHRDVWPYRDYVIEAFNRNKPFDRFTIEQLAGDLLPDANRETRIASGYNRLMQTTEEGGAQAKEYMAKYAADRVRNASTVWMGATMGCAECHDHKFDPYTARDFYSFAAFFADIQEPAVGKPPPTKVPTAEQTAQLAAMDAEIARLEEILATVTPELTTRQQVWEARTREELTTAKPDWQPVRPGEVASSGGATLTIQDDHSVLSSGTNPAKDTYTVTLRLESPRLTGLRLEALRHESFGNAGLSRANGNFVLTGFEAEVLTPGSDKPQPVKFAEAAADYSQNNFSIANAIDNRANTGWAVEGWQKFEDRTAVFKLAKPIENAAGATLTLRLRHESEHIGHNIGRFRLSVTGVDQPSLAEKQGLSPALIEALTTETEKRTPEQSEALAKHWLSIAPALDPTRKELAEAKTRRDAFDKSLPQTLVTTAGTPRTMRILPRGNWLDDSGEIVTSAVPVFLPQLEVSDRATRLDLARWFVDRNNPLTARVFVNRLWKQTFGQGIVSTLDDFGSQGAWPTHPDLLDWLAVEFVESGWDVKHMLKLIVMSGTYRQVSTATPELRQADPFNQWLARQGKFRLPAEMIRDTALSVSGLLVPIIGGPSAKPYQPAGYWAHLNFPTREYQHDSGPNQYRRGLYTYWCRTFLHPSLLAFDATSREECTVERPRSNTPLQALTLLNDPSYVEASRILAERILREGGESTESRLTFLYRLILSRPPKPEEAKLLSGLYDEHLAEYRADPQAAADLLTVGERPADKQIAPAEIAAWTSVARTALNLHEAMTRN